MSGALNFKLGDLYPNYAFSTTEETIPEAADQTALVDDQKAASLTDEKTANKTPVYLAFALIGIIAFVVGVIK